MNIKQIDNIRLGTWPTTCSTWLISFFVATTCGSQGLPISHLQINPSSSTNFYICDTLVQLNSTKMCFYAVFMTFDTVNLDVNIQYVLRNIFPRHLLLGEFHKFVKFSSAKCVYTVNSPKVPSIWYVTCAICTCIPIVLTHYFYLFL